MANLKPLDNPRDWRPVVSANPIPEYPLWRAVAYGTPRWLLIALALLDGTVGVAFITSGSWPMASAVAMALVITLVSLRRPFMRVRRQRQAEEVTLRGWNLDMTRVVENLTQSGVEELVESFERGGIACTNSLETHVRPLTTAPWTMFTESRLRSRRYENSLREYSVTRDEMKRVAEDLVTLKQWAARSSRPSAERLTTWVATHNGRDEAFIAFVRALIPIAAESDRRILAQDEAARERQRQEAIRRAKEAEERAAQAAVIAEEMRLERERRLKQEEEIARLRLAAKLDELRARMKSLKSASARLVACGDSRQSQIIEEEVARLTTCLVEFESEPRAGAFSRRAKYDHRCGKVDEVIAMSWEGACNLVGTLVDTHVIRLSGVGDRLDDALLVFLDALREASNKTWVFGSLWKTIREDRTIDLWYYDPKSRWKSISFEIELQPALPTDDAIMIVSMFIPFGLDDDTSIYPIEESTTYIRQSQELRPSVKISEKHLYRLSSQDVNGNEWTDSTSDIDEMTDRSTIGVNTTSGVRKSTNTGGSSEYMELKRHGWTTNPSREESTTDRTTNGWETSTDYRHEETSSHANERARNQRKLREAARRITDTTTDEQAVERLIEITATAVGPDFTQPDRMFESWARNKDNLAGVKTVKAIRSILPTVARLIEQSVSKHRLATRSSATGEAPSFWKIAGKLIARSNPDVFGRRTLVDHDGYPAPINLSDAAQVMRSGQALVQQLPSYQPRLLSDGRKT